MITVRETKTARPCPMERVTCQKAAVRANLAPLRVALRFNLRKTSSMRASSASSGARRLAKRAPSATWTRPKVSSSTAAVRICASSASRVGSVCVSFKLDLGLSDSKRLLSSPSRPAHGV